MNRVDPACGYRSCKNCDDGRIHSIACVLLATHSRVLMASASSLLRSPNASKRFKGGLAGPQAPGAFGRCPAHRLLGARQQQVFSGRPTIGVRAALARFSAWSSAWSSPGIAWPRFEAIQGHASVWTPGGGVVETVACLADLPIVAGGHVAVCPTARCLQGTGIAPRTKTSV